jgi:EmrB/QacA subfamily drug resistance transporter
MSGGYAISNACTAYRLGDTLYRMTETDRLDADLLKLAGIILAGAIAAILDMTIVNIAIDTLGRDLDARVSTIQWVVTGYMLAVALVMPVTGWAVDRFGGKRLWLLSLALFLGGSALCGLAWSVESLIAFRVIQGVGGGMLLPLAQTILAQAAGPRRLGRAMALVALPAQLGPILGPVIGGLIVSDLSWRWIFYVNVPVCLVALVLAWRWMPDTRSDEHHRLDAIGLALLSPALAGIVYGLSQAGGHGGFGNAAVLLPLAAGAGLLVAFAVHALRTRTEPLIDLRLLGNRPFAASSALMFTAGLSLFGAMLLLPLYYQVARGESALHAGLLLAPQGVGTMIALLAVGRLTDRLPPRPIVLAGMALAVLGTLPYALVGPDTSEALLSAALVVRGAGLGAAIVPIMAGAYAELEREAIPRATTAIRIIQQVGGSLGTAILAVILQHRLGATTPTAGFGDTFTWALAFTAVAFVPALALGGRQSRLASRAAASAESS